ncbi:MAG: thioesterase family protein [Oleispira sp.]|nr:thioesterase family protein [Oleispira sp.]MBL4880262.1 thioesterase family protein [Oleispira sp.]
MNLIFRMLRLLLLRNKLEKIAPLDVSHSQIKVWPLDCDFNLHLTNSRYPALLDLARTQYLMQINALSLFLGGGWKSVLSSQSISFIKEIKPFSKVDITTQVLYWDRKYCYIEHKFLVADKLHAKALARVAFIKGRRVRAYEKLLSELDENCLIQSPAVTEQVAAWLSLLESKKA